MNKKLIAIGTITMFFALLFAPQALAIEKEDSEPIESQTYIMANISGTIELKNSSYPFFNLFNQLIGFKKGVLWLVEAKMTTGTITSKLVGFRNIKLPLEGYSYADLTIFRYQGTLELIQEPNIYWICGNVTWLVINLVE